MIVAKGNLPVFMVDPQTGKLNPVASDAGDYAILTPDGQRLIYSRYIASTEAKQLRILNANGTQAGELSRLWGNLPPLADVVQPSLARNGALLAFSAASLTENDSTPDIFVVPTALLPTLTGGEEANSGTSLVAPARAQKRQFQQIPAKHPLLLARQPYRSSVSPPRTVAITRGPHSRQMAQI